MKMRRILLLGLAACIGLIWSCTPTRYVQPLEAGEWAVQGTFGGPLMKNFGPPIPVPFTTAGVGYGLREGTTVYGNLHLTSVLFGTAQVDAGVLQGILEPDGWRPGVSTSLGFNTAIDFHKGHFKIWPQWDANAYWRYGANENRIFVGANTWWEPKGFTKGTEEGLQAIIPGIQVGHTFRGTGGWDKTLELSVRNVGKPSGDAVVDWAGLGGAGAFGFHFSITKRF